MQIDHRQLEAAHQLGEAILRFIKVIETSKKVEESAEPSEKVPHQVENRLLRVGEAAQILSLGTSTIYDLMAKGHLPSVKIGNARRLKLSEVMKLLDGIE
jgi:excisionase family DNA binding protein